MVKIISRVYSTSKAGAGNAAGEILVFMYDISRLIETIDTGYDIMVGVHQMNIRASSLRCRGNTRYGKLATPMTGHTIEDLPSAVNAARTIHCRKFLCLLKIRFYCPMLPAMAFLCYSLCLANTAFKAGNRTVDGKSHSHLFLNGFQYLVVILIIGDLFSPMRFFLPITHNCMP